MKNPRARCHPRRRRHRRPGPLRLHRPARTPPNVEQKARELHKTILTVDTHCDTAFSLLRTDWKIGDRHDPALRASGKIDLPRMKEGGLDAEFFAAFVGQGPLTPEAYAKAKDSALRAVAAVHKMTQDYASTDRPGRRPGRRPAPQEGGQAHGLHRHGERLSDRPGPVARQALLRQRRPLHHALPFLRQRHLRLLDRPPGPRGQGPERFRPPGRGRMQPARHDRRHLARLGEVVLRRPGRVQGPDHRLPFERPGRLRQSPQPDRRPAPGPGQERRRHPDLLPRRLRQDAARHPRARKGHQGARGQVRPRPRDPRRRDRA